jgi:PAS domain S-box-containing protein
MLPFSDTPAEVADGQSLFVFTIPIFMSSVLLRPYASFLFAFISSLLISLVAVTIPIVPNFPAIAGYFMVALIAWLSSRSLENALHELMLVNRELDQRVANRTQELSDALTRERMEAGKNQAILEGIADGVLMFDMQDRAMVINPAAEQLLAQSTMQMMYKNVRKILAEGKILPDEQQAVLDLLSDPNPHRGNVRIQWGRKTLAVNAAPVRTASGEMIGKVAVFRDFTREAEVDRMKSDFVAMVSHELRTPLSSILGYAEMLREGVYGLVSEVQAGAAERIMANTRRLLAIVNDLLDQAQIDAGKLVFHNQEFHPAELIESMKSVMENIVHTKGLHLSVIIVDDMPDVVVGDIQRINQVVVNLVTNAVKFTEIGSISVRLFRVDAQRWAVEVADTGVGIPMEAQAFIFDPFRQVNMDATRQFGGIGLGLSIVKHLVALMRGEIKLQSVVDKGSTFTVILPIVAAQALPVQKEKAL